MKIKITESERNRIRNLYDKKSNLTEQEIIQPDGDPYEYKKDGDKYYTKKKTSDKWILVNNTKFYEPVKSVFDDRPEEDDGGEFQPVDYDDTKVQDTDYKYLPDYQFYRKLLTLLNAPHSDENFKFLYAWRQSEGKAGKYNPFNTTQKMPGATDFNSVGVKNYVSDSQGLKATIKTLKNGRYDCIIEGLRNDIGAINIASCKSLKTWGTGDLVGKVIKSYERGNEPKITSIA